MLRPDDVEPAAHVGADVRRDGIGEGRDPDAGREGRGLMLAVEDDRAVFDLDVCVTTCDSFMLSM